VSDLEKELDSLQYRLCHERNERLLAETHVRGCSRSLSSAPSPLPSHGAWEEVFFLFFPDLFNQYMRSGIVGRFFFWLFHFLPANKKEKKTLKWFLEHIDATKP
jgi:hypothetical protein